MEERNVNPAVIYDTVWVCVIPYVQDSRDRDAVSLVCRRWHEIDAITRQHITMALCYSAKPEQLSRRFPQLESLKLKGKPRASMFNLIPEDWGGYATPWVHEISRSFTRLKALHFRRMIVSDSDLELLVRTRGKLLQALKLDKCSGFSTDGLLTVCRSCRSLKTLFLEESTIVENDGEWIHELALNNTVLENLNFYQTYLGRVNAEDLELIAKNCPSLVSVKISECDISNLIGFFKAAVALEDFGGGSFSEPTEPAAENGYNEQLGRYSAVSFPQRLCHLGPTYLGINEMHILFPIASHLKKLDLLYAFLDTEAHCFLLQKCPNLEILEARNVVGDRGMEVLAQFCKRLKRLRIERGADEQEMEDEEGAVTQRGLIALAQGCIELEYMAVYVSDITNEALENIATYLKDLCDFRLVLLDREVTITDLPLDNGVRSLLRGCQRLRRFALYLRSGGLTDVGLKYIGQYSQNVRWMLLGYVGESDEGLMEFSRGCPSLQKLEMRGCRFTERALAYAALQLKSLRYLWIQGFSPSSSGWDLLMMARPFWNIELIPARRVITSAGIAEHPAHILAYYSLAGRRTDFPDTVWPLDP
ncbi:coronatine-insensitive protein 1 [Nicotiana tabacum]|uniref:Coronatine-insensitive protein 1 n=1 Tax=Nicotiana tabacum TaxID=4097 RepID=A0A1S3YSJ2_TOBAC|nr:coronatine-insensitive protein 1 [Nicotiana tomentosiformis]XP_016455128.1 PREDICTED: coronatine-insensitive protein 1-like [Nicotiana tabacum]